MSATLRNTVIHRRRHRREKRRTLRRQLAKAAPGDRQAIQAKLAKTYAVVAAQPPDKS